jgi:hypothetical protein
MEYETIDNDSIDNDSIDNDSIHSYSIDMLEIDSFVIDSIEVEPIDINYNSIKEYCPVINSRDIDYELNNTMYITGDIKCKNYEFCYDTVIVGPFKSNYLCYDCNSRYEKKLEIKENVECPICLEIKRCVLQPRCSHVTCVDCFKLCYYSHEIIRPIFPYSMIKDEYNEDKKNPKWKDYPLIKIYRAKMKKYIGERNEKKKKTFLKKCPLCRK